MIKHLSIITPKNLNKSRQSGEIIRKPPIFYLIKLPVIRRRRHVHPHFIPNSPVLSLALVINPTRSSKISFRGIHLHAAFCVQTSRGLKEAGALPRKSRFRMGSCGGVNIRRLDSHLACVTSRHFRNIAQQRAFFTGVRIEDFPRKIRST
jgi:hypothetical protein